MLILASCNLPVWANESNDSTPFVGCPWRNLSQKATQVWWGEATKYWVGELSQGKMGSLCVRAIRHHSGQDCKPQDNSLQDFILCLRMHLAPYVQALYKYVFSDLTDIL